MRSKKIYIVLCVFVLCSYTLQVQQMLGPVGVVVGRARGDARVPVSCIVIATIQPKSR